MEWAGERVARWLRAAPGLERQLAPVSELLFAAAVIALGEHVLDVGCGTGPTTRQAALLAGPSGAVAGLDVSGDMLAAAAAVPLQEGAAPVEWLEADAVTWEPTPAAFDLLLSRFGVMFFSDRTAALARLTAAVRPGGRLAFAVWAERGSSPLFDLPYRIAVDVCRSRGRDVELVPPDDGPCSWADPDTARGWLSDAGWNDPHVDTHRLTLPFAGGLPPREAAESAKDFGPTHLLLVDADADTVAAVEDALTAEYANHLDADGHVVLDATVHIVTARR